MKFEKIVRKDKSLGANISASKIDSLRSKSDIQTTYRVYDNNCIGVAGRIGNGDDELLKKEAIEKIAQGIPYPCNLASGKNHVDARKNIIAEKDYLKTLNRLLEKLSTEFSDFSFFNKINMFEKEIYYTNSEGADYSYKANNIMISIVVKDKNSANIMDASIGAHKNYFDEDLLLEDARHQLNAFRNKIELPEEKLPILIDNGLVYMFVKDLVAEVYGGGASLLKDKLGKKAFNEKFTLEINRKPDNDHSIAFFDAEGVVLPNYRTPLIENGVLKGLLTTKRSAAMFGYEVSGTAASMYDSVPAVGIEGMSLVNTSDHLSKITNRAIYIAVTSGGDITPSGDIGMPVQLAYLYEDGKLVGRLPELMISGNLFDVLGDGFMGCAKNPWEKYGTEDFLVVNMEVKKQK